MFPFGTSVALLDAPVSVKLAAAVSTSPTVKPIGAVEVMFGAAAALALADRVAAVFDELAAYHGTDAFATKARALRR